MRPSRAQDHTLSSDFLHLSFAISLANAFYYFTPTNLKDCPHRSVVSRQSSVKLIGNFLHGILLIIALLSISDYEAHTDPIRVESRFAKRVHFDTLAVFNIVPVLSFS